MEKISIVDEKDRVLFDVVKKEFNKDSGSIYRVVGIIVVNSLGDILIHKRRPKKGKLLRRYVEFGCGVWSCYG